MAVCVAHFTPSFRALGFDVLVSRLQFINTNMSLPTFGFSTTAEEVADTFADQVRGKNVLVTGTSLNGIGFETARAIAKYANMVIITGYNSERLQLSEDAIKKDIPNANIRQLNVDLTSLESVRKAAAEVNGYPGPLHVLIHNAAYGGGPLKPTPDNLEPQMATAQFGPFLLTKLLLPKILAARSATYTPRVVIVASENHQYAGVDLKTVVEVNPETYSTMGRYAEVKSANILFAAELARRAAGKLKAFSLHPGGEFVLFLFIALRNGHLTQHSFMSTGALTPEGLPNEAMVKFKTIPQGAATTVFAAFDTRIEDQSGSYLVDCVVANEKIAPHCTNEETAKKLWEISEEVVGEKFTF
ncbi:short-chain dehydrogenase/reductase family protein [Favolaschia claudopus]|uniref:Short-chain dehydrogenase/reductase family protein n=1 Tax=Favolaschia claudopus TaxID=2862362 RepID=A0AAW0EG54_9AGAR